MCKKVRKILAFILAFIAVFLLWSCSDEKVNETVTNKVEKASFVLTTEKISVESTEKIESHSASIDLNTSGSVSEPAEEQNSEQETDFQKWWESIGLTTTLPQTTENKKPKAPGNKGNDFFDDAVFIGDSVTMGLRNYVTSERNAGRKCLGSAQFLCSGSMGYSNTLLPLDHKEGIHPKVNGQKVFVEDGVKELGGKKIFIMLGMNDYCLYDFDTVVKNAETLIGKIDEKNPGCEYYIQSVTPVIAAKETKRFNNTNIDAFNECLVKMCDENGWTYIDINSLFKDENGKFEDSYCSDKEAQGIHLSMAGCKVWADYLMKEF